MTTAALTPACMHCGGDARFVEHSAPYRQGIERGPIWVCDPCDAWVGCHPGTSIPLGRPAAASLRRMRSRAHAAFDRLWSEKLMSRPSAYRWLADNMGLDPKDAHVALMDEDQCHLAEALALWWIEEGHKPQKRTRKKAEAVSTGPVGPNPQCPACHGRGNGVALVDGTDPQTGRRRGWQVALPCAECAKVGTPEVGIAW